MVKELKRGTLPDSAALRGRCRAALCKKLALVSQPPTYWLDDPKRNPDSEQLLWAVLLLQDSDMLDLLTGIILLEQAESDGLTIEEFTARSVKHLLHLAPDRDFREQLEHILP